MGKINKHHLQICSKVMNAPQKMASVHQDVQMMWDVMEQDGHDWHYMSPGNIRWEGWKEEKIAKQGT